MTPPPSDIREYRFWIFGNVGQFVFGNVGQLIFGSVGWLVFPNIFEDKLN